MLLIAPISAVIALILALVLYKSMMRAPEGNETMRGIAADVRSGAKAYLVRQYKVVGLAFAALFLLLGVLSYLGVQNPFVPVAFLTGGMFSALCGFIGMITATHASGRTAQGCTEGLNRGLQVSFRAGSVMGMVVVGFALLDIVAWFWVLDRLVFTAEHLRDGLHLLGVTLVHHNELYTDSATGLLSADGMHYKYTAITTTMLTFGMGASLQALFARLGGGIFTKAADVGADLVGKVEAGIPEDDPRNPATIADNVGDNVGDVAGMGADLYESYCGSIISTAALGAGLPMLYLQQTGMTREGVVTAPMIVAGCGILLSIVGIFLVRSRDGASQKQLLRSLLVATGGASVLVLAAVAGLAGMGVITWGLFGAICAGLVAGVIVGQATEYHTSGAYRPTLGISDQARMGPATTVLEGMFVGLSSVGATVTTIVAGILAAFTLAGGFGEGGIAAGLYGVSFAAVGMLSTLGITLATDAYGPIADNAGGNAEMAGLGAEVRACTDALDSLGNTTAAIGKGFAIGSAALTALALMAAYLEEVRFWLYRSTAMVQDGFIVKGAVLFHKAAEVPEQGVEVLAGMQADGVRARSVQLGYAGVMDFVEAYGITLLNPLVLCGLFLGAMAAFVFAAMTLKAVGHAAGAMVEEVRRQFRGIAGILDYQPGDMSPENQARKPDYARCVAIATRAAQGQMLLPALLGVAIPVLVGLFMGVAGVVGLLAGVLVAGFCLATTLNNAGGAWDNAKKAVEAGRHHGKFLQNENGEWVDAAGRRVERREDARNPIHAATVIGDTVGDPFKDTAGPALNILIKLMAMVSVVFSGLVVSCGIPN